MKDHRVSDKRISIILVLLCLGLLLCALAATFRVNFHRLFWTLRQPQNYQIVIRGSNASQSFEKMTCVEDGALIFEQLLSGNERDVPLKTSLTISNLFNLAGECNPIDPYCLVEFDRYYHYPTLIEQYEGCIIHVEILVAGDDSGSSCPSRDS